MSSGELIGTSSAVLIAGSFAARAFVPSRARVGPAAPVAAGPLQPHRQHKPTRPTAHKPRKDRAESPDNAPKTGGLPALCSVSGSFIEDYEIVFSAFDHRAIIPSAGWTWRPTLQARNAVERESAPMKAWTSGNVAGTGTFRCTDCDYPVSLDAVDELPTCPNCGGTEFVRASLFTTAQTSVVADFAPETDDRAWLDEVRDGLSDPGQYLAYRTDDRDVVAYALEREWTRIGRSLAADIRFDDPTVSRRHALIVRQPDGLRVLDDRSLNGVFVNGERVEWSTLADGDEIVIGRHRLYFVDLPAVSGVRYRHTADSGSV
ncbi:MAG TPA: FHA domain-containing protein [Solirubrobacteraceae bacterium]